MPGAYTSTPIIVTPPDVPDGWDGDWNFPPSGVEDGGPDGGPYGGPFPPGYDPSYSLGVTAPSTIPYGAPTASVTAKIYDHTTYGTAQPFASQIDWTATLDGREVMTLLSVDYTLSGGFWGYSSSFIFDVTVADEGKVIILSAESAVFGGVAISDSVNIEVIAPVPISAEASLVINSHTIEASSAPKVTLKIERLPSHSSRRDWPQVGATEYGAPPASWWSDDTTYDTLAEFTCTAQHVSAQRIDASAVSLVADSSYKMTFQANEGGNATIDVTFSVIITMDDATTRSDEKNYTISPYGDTETEYVTFHTGTGVAYIFGTKVN